MNDSLKLVAGRLRRLGGSGPAADQSVAPTHTTSQIPVVVTPQELYLTPLLSASVNAVLGALRWGAVLLGLVFAANQAANGERLVVATVAIAIFLTSWRTISPLKLGDESSISTGLALADVVILSLAVSLFQGFANPMVGTLFVAIAVAAMGWGLPTGVASAALAVVVVSLGRVLGPDIDVNRFDRDLLFALFPNTLAVTALAGLAILPGVALNRLLEFEGRRKMLVSQRDKLAEANELLASLNDLARTLPSSLDLTDVVQNTRRQLVETFDARRLALLSFEGEKWATVLQDGFSLPPEFETEELPEMLEKALLSNKVVRIDDLSQISERTGSGLYTRLVIRNADTGLLAIEHNEPGQYEASDVELLTGMANVLALTLANARSFGKLRSLAAAEERSRIARDLHDRLGQYLTYIALEIERINTSASSSELKELHEDVQGAIAEFRGTLLELRAAVTPERPLSTVLTEVVDRFRARSEVEVTLDVPAGNECLPSRIENELLRIAQEALTNVEKHAQATKVHVTWSIDDGRGVLVVQDDGRGFDPSQGIRGNAYGLVGMRERAASVGALLTISSQPGDGTVITVQSIQTGDE